MRQPREEEISAGEAWAIFLIIVMLLIACASVGADIYLNMGPK